jgi:hypothetical protein
MSWIPDLRTAISWAMGVGNKKNQNYVKYHRLSRWLEMVHLEGAMIRSILHEAPAEHRIFLFATSFTHPSIV